MISVTQARARAMAQPVYLVKIMLMGSGAPTLYLAERDITVASTRYEAYLDSVSGMGGMLERLTSDGLNSSLLLRLRNEPWRQYSHLVEVGADYPFEGAPMELSELYLGPGGEPSEADLIFTGILEGPSRIALSGFSCNITSLEFRADLKQ